LRADYDLQTTGCSILDSGLKDYNINKTMNRLDEFRSSRKAMNEKIMELDNLGVKRFFNLDTNTYRDGALSGRNKELLGLVASAVLRCNDCIDYHLEQCAEAGWTKDEIVDALNVALIVGGSIVIPHMRHAVGTLEILEKEGNLKN
jgi:AhpD family alkylhydroperoxidase